MKRLVEMLRTKDEFFNEARNKKNKPLKNLGFGEIDEIDIASDDIEDEFEFILNMTAKGVLCNRLESIGPGGGNPMYQMIAINDKAKKYLKKWLIDEYCDGDDEWAKDFWCE